MLTYFNKEDQMQLVSVHSLAAGKKVILFDEPPAPSPIPAGVGENLPGNMHVKFLADGVGKYTLALGLELDLSDKVLGIRSRRYALLVEDLEVKVANIESGGEFTISGADEILEAL